MPVPALTLLAAPATAEHHQSGHALMIIFGVAAILIGALHVVKPDLTWRMSRWQYRNRQAFEPSNAGLMAIRIGGAVAIVFGVVFLVIGIS